jgi:hypothetical protein
MRKDDQQLLEPFEVNQAEHPIGPPKLRFRTNLSEVFQ